MDESMKLVIGWTVVVAFIFTTGATCASLVGWVTFANKKQQQGLYAALILEIVVGAGGTITGNARFSPTEVGEELRSEGGMNAISGVVDEALAGTAPTADRDQLLRLVDRVEVRPDTVVSRQKDELRAAIGKLPAGRVTAEKAIEIRKLDALTRRRQVTP